MNRFVKSVIAAALAIPFAASGYSVSADVSTLAAPPAPAADQGQKVGVDETVSTGVGGGVSTSTTLHRPDAWYVKVHVSGLKLQPGDSITVADPRGAEVYSYSADPADGRRDGDAPGSPDENGFWALSISGDTAVVTLRGANGAAPSPLSTATIDRITRGYTPSEFAAAQDAQPRSICGTNDYKDAACYQTSNPAEFAKSNSVAKLLRSGSSLCTAWRVGANNRLLTNNHCFTTPANIEVWFNYQCPTCGGTATAPVTKVLASQVIRTNAALDYTLFSVTDFAKISSFGYLELDNRVPDVGERMYVVGHPAGKLKKISLKDTSTTTGNCQVRAVKVNGSSTQSDISYMCDTEGGSSGSPVLSGTTHKVIGLHHYGGCPNQGVRIDLIHAQIGPQL